MRCLMLELNKIYNMDCMEGLKQLDSESVDCCITSPPYWALRDYGDSVTSIWDEKEDCEHEWISNTFKQHSGRAETSGVADYIKNKEIGDTPDKILERSFCSKCSAWKGQLGLEPTFELYIKHLIQIFDEVKRVLKKTGTCWVNLGDSYLGSNQGHGDNPERDSLQNSNDGYFSSSGGKSPLSAYKTQAKCMALIPERFAIEMVSHGWILRNKIVWFKRNSMPSSVKDRFSNKWEHIFFFVKNRKYFFDLDAVRKPLLPASIVPNNAGYSKASAFNYRVREALKGTLEPKFGSRYKATEEEKSNYKQDNVPSKNKRLYKGFNERWKTKHNSNPLGGNPGDHWDITTQPHPFAHFAVYPEKLCEMPIKSGCAKDGIVLDPFIGSGTTALVAKRLGRNYIGFELNKEYIGIAKKRLNEIEHPLTQYANNR